MIAFGNVIVPFFSVIGNVIEFKKKLHNQLLNYFYLRQKIKQEFFNPYYSAPSKNQFLLNFFLKFLICSPL